MESMNYQREKEEGKKKKRKDGREEVDSLSDQYATAENFGKASSNLLDAPSGLGF